MILWRTLARARIKARRRAERKWMRAQLIAHEPKQDDRDWQGKFERGMKEARKT